MPADFNGTWELEKNENFEEFLKEMDVPWLKQKGMSLASCTQTIVQNGDEFDIKITAAIMNKEMKFKIGEPFDNDHFGKAKATASWEGDNLRIDCVPEDSGRKPHTAIRELTDPTTSVVTMTCGSVVGKRIFKKK